jgi:hypothetical protein
MKRWMVNGAVVVTFLTSICFAETKSVNKKTPRAKEEQRVEQPTATKQEPKKLLTKFTMDMVEGNKIDIN